MAHAAQLASAVDMLESTLQQPSDAGNMGIKMRFDDDGIVSISLVLIENDLPSEKCLPWSEPASLMQARTSSPSVLS